MAAPAHCARCGGVLSVPFRGEARCTRCGRPHTCHSLAANKFPLTLKLLSGKTGEVLWSRAVTIDEARQLAKVEIPGYANTEHYPVRVEIEYADGTTEIQGKS
jgi:hypothetical protein